MVNRKDDGTTVYSFLCYGLMEKEGRPNAFFGCSVTLDDNRYCPDLKGSLRVVRLSVSAGVVGAGNVLFFVNDGGILQYKVDKFSDIPDEIDWLKSNLPNIFTEIVGCRSCTLRRHLYHAQSRQGGVLQY